MKLKQTSNDFESAIICGGVVFFFFVLPGTLVEHTKFYFCYFFSVYLMSVFVTKKKCVDIFFFFNKISSTNYNIKYQQTL